MLMIAAFCPPDDVVTELHAAVEAGDAAWSTHQPDVAEAPARRKWFGRSAAPEPPPAPSRTSIAQWAAPIIPVVRFGNLTTADARRVVDAITAVSVEWAPVSVQFERVVFGSTDAPRSVQAILGGEVTGLDTIARAVTSRAADLNFYLDRRLFHAQLEVATMTESTTDDDLAGLTESMHDFCGRTWTVDHVSVLKQTFGEGTPTFVQEFAIPLGPA